MQTLNDKNFFFFYKDCSGLEIKPKSVEHAYVALINKDLLTADAIFRSIDSPRAKWGSILVSIMNGYIDIYPTYFQIRNFLEIDMDLLIKNNLIDYVEQLLGALDFLSEINQETYKYTARVMYENKLYASAIKYMEKSKKINYNDAELHFMLTKYYMRTNDFENANHYIKECLRLLPDYYPALTLKQQIEEYIN